MIADRATWRAANVSIVLLLCVGSLCAQTATGASELSDWAPPWHESTVPLPSHQSIEVTEHDVPLWLTPGSGKRGASNGGSRFLVFGTQHAGRGCRQQWVLIGPQAWLCAERTRWSARPANPVRIRATGTGLPYDYFFVGPDGTFGYATLTLAGEGIPDSQLEPGFAVAAERFRERLGESFARTTNGLWVPVRDLVPVRSSPFQGVHVSDDTGALPDVVWVVNNRRGARRAPSGSVSRRLPRLTALEVIDRQTHAGRQWLRTEEGDWVRRTDVAARTLGPWPDDLRVGERWIDVDLENQVLTAFEGKRAVFATLVATGRGADGSATATPLGEHRVWVKLGTTDMTNLEDQAASQFYAMEAVPWVMFFKGGYGLHGAFWHDAFGTKRSHGCINLSPKDAAFLFGWTAPTLPAGWHAVHPTEFEAGTRVRVR